MHGQTRSQERTNGGSIDLFCFHCHFDEVIRILFAGILPCLRKIEKIVYGSPPDGRASDTRLRQKVFISPRVSKGFLSYCHLERNALGRQLSTGSEDVAAARLSDERMYAFRFQNLAKQFQAFGGRRLIRQRVRRIMWNQVYLRAQLVTVRKNRPLSWL